MILKHQRVKFACDYMVGFSGVTQISLNECLTQVRPYLEKDFQIKIKTSIIES